MKNANSFNPLKNRVLRYALFASLLFTHSFQKAEAQGSLSANLVHQYCFNGDASDSKGGKHGTVMPGATLTTDRSGVANQAYEFDGISGYIDLPDGVYVHGNFTISAWVSVTFPTPNWTRVFEFGNGSTNGDNVFYSPSVLEPLTMFYKDIYKVHKYDCNSPKSVSIQHGYGATFPSGWTFITIVQDGSTAHIYRNGSLVSSNLVSPPCSVLRTENFFGKSNFPSNPFFKGKIDDIRIYNKALVKSEIEYLYSLTSCESSASTACDESCYWTLEGNSPLTTSTKNILGTKTAVDVRLFANGQRGVLTKDGNFGWGTGTGVPSSRFHVDLSSTILGTGLRFQGLPTEPTLTDVLVVDGAGNVAKRPVSTLTGGPSGTGWGLLGNSVSSTDFIGTTNNEHFQFKTNGGLRGMITKDGNFDFGSNDFSSFSNLKSCAVGDLNRLVNAHNSLASGKSNFVKLSSESGCFGLKDSVIESNYSFAFGSENLIAFGNETSGVDACVALGARNKVTNSNESVVAGEENILNESHGSFIGGSHNKSNAGSYNMIIGLFNKNFGDQNITIGNENEQDIAGYSHIYGNSSYTTGSNNFTFGNQSKTYGMNNYSFGNGAESIGASNYAFGNSAKSIGVTLDGQANNIFTFGEGITNRRNNSMIFGFDNNRTEVITKRGVAIQLQDPSPLVTYDPTVNFEIQAGVLPGLSPLPIPSTIRSNVRFHHLPTTNIQYPPVVIDPSTGELFMLDISSEFPMQSQMKPDDSSFNKKDPSNNIQNIVSLQQAQIIELQKQIDELKSALKASSSLSSDFEATAKDGYLAQNVPNPFSISTNIQYELPKGTEKATIGVYDMNGKEIKLFQLSLDKTGNVTIKGGDLMPGMYLYTLIINGKYFDSKKMILTSN